MSVQLELGRFDPAIDFVEVRGSFAGWSGTELLLRDGTTTIYEAVVDIFDPDGTQLEYVREVERVYRQRIESILAPILGPENVRAQVTAEVNFARREETNERYGPNQGGNPAAVRSSQTRAVYSGGEDLAQGVPGALTNTPPGAAASPVQQNDDQQEGENTEDDDDTTKRLNHEDVINYEVDRNITHVQHERGQVERLSVAVVVDYRDGVNEDGEAAPVPRDDPPTPFGDVRSTARRSHSEPGEPSGRRRQDEPNQESEPERALELVDLVGALVSGMELDQRKQRVG